MSNGFNVSFWQISVMYAVKFGEKMPLNLPYSEAAAQVRKDCVNESAFGWLVEQSKLCQNAKLSVDEAVSVIKGRIAADAEYA